MWMWMWNTDRKSNQTLTCVSKAASSSRDMGPVKVNSSFIIPTVTVTLINTSVHTFPYQHYICIHCFVMRKSRLKRALLLIAQGLPGQTQAHTVTSFCYLKEIHALVQEQKVISLVKANTLKTVWAICENWPTSTWCEIIGYRRQSSWLWMAIRQTSNIIQERIANHGLLLYWLYSNTMEEELKGNYIGEFLNDKGRHLTWLHFSNVLTTRQTLCYV